MRIDAVLYEQLPKFERDSFILIVGMPDEGAEYSFSRSGCDLIDTLACNTVEVTCLLVKRNITGRIIESTEFKADVCESVLDFSANGTIYYRGLRGDWIPEYEFNRKVK